MRKPWLHFLWALPALVILVFSVLYVISNIHGKAAWKKQVETLAARGETLQVKDLLGPAAASEENVLLHPFWSSPELMDFLRTEAITQDAILLLRSVPHPRTFDHSAALLALLGEPSGNPADDHAQLHALAELRIAGWLDAYREAATRPYLDWNIDDQLNAAEAHARFGALRQMGQAFCLVSLAALLDGKPDAALVWMQEAERAFEFTIHSSIFETHLYLAAATLGPMIAVSAYGMEHGLWTPENLLELEQIFSRIYLRKWMADGLRMERAVFVTNHLRSTAEVLQNQLGLPSSPEGWDGYLLFGILALRPTGWDHEDRALQAELYQKAIDMLEDEALPTAIAEIRRFQPTAGHSPWSLVRHPMREKIGVQNGQFALRMAYLETQIQMLRIAIALKLERARTGVFPESLESLPLPEPSLALDRFTGQPLNYRKDGDSYRLYSTGPNGSDENGKLQQQMHESPDWVFR